MRLTSGRLVSLDYAVNSYSGVALSTWSLYETLRDLVGRCKDCGRHTRTQPHNPDCPKFTRERGR